jgi:hypothetical protein
MSEPRLARIKRFSGYVEMMLENPANPKIGGIGVQTKEICTRVVRIPAKPYIPGFG